MRRHPGVWEPGIVAKFSSKHSHSILKHRLIKPFVEFGEDMRWFAEKETTAFFLGKDYVTFKELCDVNSHKSQTIWKKVPIIYRRQRKWGTVKFDWNSRKCLLRVWPGGSYLYKNRYKNIAVVQEAQRNCVKKHFHEDICQLLRFDIRVIHPMPSECPTAAKHRLWESYSAGKKSIYYFKMFSENREFWHIDEH